jgi:hypothetical protein
MVEHLKIVAIPGKAGYTCAAMHKLCLSVFLFVTSELLRTVFMTINASTVYWASASRIRSIRFLSTFRSALLVLLATPLFLLSGCVADPALVQEIFPLMPASLRDAPPPGIQVLLEAERERLLGLQPDGSIDVRAISSNVVPPDVTLLTSEDDLQALTATGAEAVGEAEAESEAPATLPQVTVRNRSVNIRSGPGTNFSVVAGATQGTTFEVLGRTEEPIWWRICCIRGPEDGPDEATQQAWISDIVVTVNELATEQPLIGPLFPDDLQTQWDVTYVCGSERCEVPQCTATISAAVRNATDTRWLEIERKVTWDDGCGEDSTWLHQIDRTEGTERYTNAAEFFFFNFWAGANPGPLNSLFSLDVDTPIKTWCSDEQSVELEEGDGWSALYNGITCHDLRTGMLVSMKYTKRWLFTGTFEDEEYERAYFGDFEVYEVRLGEGNVELAYVNPPVVVEASEDTETNAEAEE